MCHFCDYKQYNLNSRVCLLNYLIFTLLFQLDLIKRGYNTEFMAKNLCNFI